MSAGKVEYNLVFNFIGIPFYGQIIISSHPYLNNDNLFYLLYLQMNGWMDGIYKLLISSTNSKFKNKLGVKLFLFIFKFCSSLSSSSFLLHFLHCIVVEANARKVSIKFLIPLKYLFVDFFGCYLTLNLKIAFQTNWEIFVSLIYITFKILSVNIRYI